MQSGSETFFSVFVLSEYLNERGQDTSFEELPIPQLAGLLTEFYMSLRTKDGKRYSKSAYVNIHSALNRYLNAPPFNKEINLMRNKCFLNANQIFSGVLKQLRESGLDVSKHKSAICEGDMKKMYSSGFLAVTHQKHYLTKCLWRSASISGEEGERGCGD